MLAGLHALPDSPERKDHEVTYQVILGRLLRSETAPAHIHSRDGMVARSHIASSHLLRLALSGDSMRDSDEVQKILSDRASWSHTTHLKLDCGSVSFGSGLYLVYVFPSVRLAAIAVGLDLGLADPGAAFMRTQIAGGELHRVRSVLHHRTPPIDRLAALLKDLELHAGSAPTDEYVWLMIGHLRLLLNYLPEADSALKYCQSLAPCDEEVRVDALYDVACIRARLGDEHGCREALSQWIALEPTKQRIRHAAEDDDFAFVRRASWFAAMLENGGSLQSG
jgi:hypothetical protein